MPKITLTNTGGYYKVWCAQEYEYYTFTKAQLKTLFLFHELYPDKCFDIDSFEMHTSKGFLKLGKDGNFFKEVVLTKRTDYPYQDVIC